MTDLATDLAAIRAVKREIKQMSRAAAELWRTTRAEALLTRYTDPAALRAVRYAVERAYPCSWLDVETAIRSHGSLEFTKAPWHLDQWIAEARAARERTMVRPLDEQVRRLEEKAEASTVYVAPLDEQLARLGAR